VSRATPTIDLSQDLGRGTVEAIITSEDFEVPTAVAKFGDRLAVVNSKIDTGFLRPPQPTTSRSSAIAEGQSRARPTRIRELKSSPAIRIGRARLRRLPNAPTDILVMIGWS
jgi:hypothetical protein